MSSVTVWAAQTAEISRARRRRGYLPNISETRSDSSFSPDTGMLDLPEDTDALGPLAETTEFFGIKSGADTDGEAESEKTADKTVAADTAVSDDAASDGEPDSKTVGGLEESDGDADKKIGDTETDTTDETDGDESGDDNVTEFSPEQPLPHVIESLLADAVSAANDAVYERASKEKKLRGMGTTVVAALTVDNRLYIASVGDSRIYLFCGGDMVQLTRDHSYVQYLIDMGQITPEEALTNPYRNVITRAVGNEKSGRDGHLVHDAYRGADHTFCCVVTV